MAAPLAIALFFCRERFLSRARLRFTGHADERSIAANGGKPNDTHGAILHSVPAGNAVAAGTVARMLYQAWGSGSSADALTFAT